MVSRWLRLGIRTQIIVIVLISAVLTTAVTLLIANISFLNYGADQQQFQANRNLNVAVAVLHAQFGQSVSIAADGEMVFDTPLSARAPSGLDANFGKFHVDTQTDYVDYVHNLLTGDTSTNGQGDTVSVYKCANQYSAPLVDANQQLTCPRISSSLIRYDANGNPVSRTITVNGTDFTTIRDINTPDHSISLSQTVVSKMGLSTGSPSIATGQETIRDTDYIVAYRPLTDPQGHLVGVLAVGEPLTAIIQARNNTVIALIISGLIIMIAGSVLAIAVASTISSTLQNAASQLSLASTQLSEISEQQSTGSRQQVWAINAINQALSTMQESATDVAQRTDQLTSVGAQVLQRRYEITPEQFEAVINLMTRQSNDIRMASRQQAATVDRMNGAMQAVVEIADQVANASQQTTESAKRLDMVVSDLKRLVAGRNNRRRDRTSAAEAPSVKANGNRKSRPTEDASAAVAVRPADNVRNGMYDIPGVPVRSGASMSRPNLPSSSQPPSRPNR
jgi:Single cache domain 3